MADTDSTSARVGILTTSVIETGSYYFGIKTGDSSEQLKAVDMDALAMTAAPEPEPISVNNVTEDKTEEAVEEEVVPEEPAFIPEPVVFDKIDFASLAEQTDKRIFRNYASILLERIIPIQTNILECFQITI